MVITFPVAIARLPSDKQAKVETLLRRWSDESDIGRTVVPNLRDLEHFLDADDMEPILVCLFTHHAIVDLRALEAKYQAECFKYGRRGGAVREDADYPFPQVVGRAVNRVDFEKWLFRAYGPAAVNPLHRHFQELDDAVDFVDRLLAGGPLTPAEQTFPMSSYGAWVTWMPHLPPADPFAFLETDRADEVRAWLGLDAAYEWELLLLRYPFAAADVKRPTVADAEIFNYFAPPDSSFELHGWTKPWKTGFLRRAGVTASNVGPRPEGVHDPIVFAHLRLPAEVKA